MKRSLVLMVLCLTACSCGKKSEVPSQASSVPVTPVAAVQTVDPAGNDVLNKVAFKNEAEVRAILGEPVYIYQDTDRLRWFYKISTKGMDGVEVNPEIQFMEGEVRFVINYSPEITDDHIATAKLNTVAKPNPPADRKKYSFEEFFNLTKDKTRSEIVANVGDPDEKNVIQGQEVWQYQNVLQVGDTLMHAAIRFDSDKAVDVQGGK